MNFFFRALYVLRIRTHLIKCRMESYILIFFDLIFMCLYFNFLEIRITQLLALIILVQLIIIKIDIFFLYLFN